MNRKYSIFENLGKIYYIVISALIIQAVISVFFSLNLFIILSIITLVVIIATLILSKNTQRHLRRFISSVSHNLKSPGSDALSRFSIPILITSSDKIVWYNESFRNTLLDGSDIYDEDLESVIVPEDLDVLNRIHQVDISYNDRFYAVYDSMSHIKDAEQRILYFFDETKLVKISREYALSRPSVAIVAIDNLEEINNNAKDSEKASIISTIEKEIENWSSSNSGLNRKLSTGRYLLILEERFLQKFIKDRFNVLDKVRELDFGDRGRATLSIGVGHDGNSINECEELAKQALDMALGRGGDQAAVKNKHNEFQFFGGLSKTVEKRTKVRARIVSTAIKELIEGSDRVILMGHRYADLDCFGASFGLWSVIKSMGKEAHIVMDRTKTLAGSLLKQIEAQGITDCITDGNELLPIIDKKTLLIVLDTHRPSFLDNPMIYDACETVVVVDHHRKAIDHIDKSVIFYHETSTSSTCEMVTEMLQYIGDKKFGKLVAEGLLSGIMLDTRNFVLNTGVRTFEAAAFLINRGADPVQVKGLFSGSMPLYRQRCNIVASAEIYKDCAISENAESDENTRIASAQAADELLNISDVNASFVLCSVSNEINISARSFGEVNVQLIMESLGGGGHRTMAACQIKSKDFKEAKLLLINAIDEYKNSMNPGKTKVD